MYLTLEKEGPLGMVFIYAMSCCISKHSSFTNPPWFTVPSTGMTGVIWSILLMKWGRLIQLKIICVNMLCFNIWIWSCRLDWKFSKFAPRLCHWRILIWQEWQPEQKIIQELILRTFVEKYKAFSLVLIISIWFKMELCLLQFCTV